MKRLMRRAAYSLIRYKAEKIRERIARHDVISFDLFDTLVLRDTLKPEDLFYLIEIEYFNKTGRRIDGFKRVRVEAQDKARIHAKGREMTLSDIYGEMQYNQEDKDTLMTIEITLEKKVSTTNLYVKELYDYALCLNKRIVITTDMYLPQEVIETIIQKAGYKQYERLYLSNIAGASKSHGKIYDIIARELGVHKKSIIHIGDNVRSDYLMCRIKGIESILIDKVKPGKFQRNRRRKGTNYIQYSVLSSFIKNRERTDSFTEALGKEVLAPLLFGYSKWLHNISNKDGRKHKILFLSREGLLLKQAYEALYPEETDKIEYLYASRQALVSPQMVMQERCDNFFDYIRPLTHVPTIQSIGESLNLDSDNIEEIAAEVGCNVGDNVLNATNDTKEKIFKQIIKKRDYGQEQIDLISKYINGMTSGFDLIVISDVGWQGTMQRMLSNYTNDIEDIGCYFGVRNVLKGDVYKDVKRYGYLFQPGRNNKYDLMMRYTNEVLETLFMNREGTVLKYKENGGVIIPCLDKSEYGERTLTFVKDVQESALEVLNEINASWVKNFFDEIDINCIMIPYINFAVYPDRETINCFSHVNYKDGNSELRKIVPDKSLLYYLFHPNKLKNEINSGVCKVFFLKKLFKIPFPYFELLCFLTHNLHYQSNYLNNMKAT